MPRYYELSGRVYEVEARPDMASANTFMEANPDYGLLSERPGGECVMAALDNKGVPVADLASSVRELVEAD